MIFVITFYIDDLNGRRCFRPALFDVLRGSALRAVLALDGAERGKRGQVRSDAGDGPRRGQVVLAAGPEPALG